MTGTTKSKDALLEVWYENSKGKIIYKEYPLKDVAEVLDYKLRRTLTKGDKGN